MYSIIFALEAYAHSVAACIFDCCSYALHKAFPKYYPGIAQEASAPLFDGIVLVEAITKGIQYLCQHLYLVLKPSLLFFLMTLKLTKRRGGHPWWMSLIQMCLIHWATLTQLCKSSWASTQSDSLCLLLQERGVERERDCSCTLLYLSSSVCHI